MIPGTFLVSSSDLYLPLLFNYILLLNTYLLIFQLHNFNNRLTSKPLTKFYSSMNNMILLAFLSFHKKSIKLIGKFYKEYTNSYLLYLAY